MYTDPGSGLFFMQVAIAGLLTAVYRFRRALTSLLRMRRDTDAEE
jgi:hypothetical protein